METISTEAGLSAYQIRSGDSGNPTICTSRPPFGVFATSDLSGIEAVTDAGRAIPLFHYEASFILQPGQHLDPRNEAQCSAAFRSSEAQFLANTNQEIAKLTRVLDPFLGSNCHGWVFAGGRFGIKDEYVVSILTDHAYSVVTDPADGDLAVYRDDETAFHSGLVLRSPNGAILVESKWGPFGVFRHSPEAYIFKNPCVFYRTTRPRHALALQPTNR